MTIFIKTDRLILRSWEDRDRKPFVALNADPEVMRYFPAMLSGEESDAMIERMRANVRNDGFSFSPIEEKSSDRFLGFVGLNRPRYQAPLPFDPCVEIGWRLDRSAWGKGYATEAARAWLRFGFETLGMEEIVSFTTRTNLPSQKVMQRLGMSHDPQDDFEHPALAAGHSLRPHVLYRLSRQRWLESLQEL